MNFYPALSKLFVVILSGLVGASAIAAPTTPAAPSAQSETSIQAPKAETTDEADQIITNRQLRASTGSLSMWSMNTFWSYSAGAINDPFSVVRPNITAAGDVGALQSLYADIGVRYRISAKDSATLSVGMNMVSPFHFSIDTEDAGLREEFEQNAHKLSMNDPSISLRHIDKLAGIQSISSISFAMYTSEFRRNAGFRTGIGISQNFMYEIGKSGLSIGTAFQGAINTFGGDVDTSRRPAFTLGVYPAVEYVINDKFNLRTVSGVWVHEFRRNGSGFNRIVYQSVGLGVSVARDVFIYPNVQFLPGDLRADKTNIGLSANVNLF
jgi:hypothetical protein